MQERPRERRREVGGSFGGSYSSIGSGVSRLVYWPFGVMFRVASGTFLRTYVGLYVGNLLTDLNKQWVCCGLGWRLLMSSSG